MTTTQVAVAVMTTVLAVCLPIAWRAFSDYRQKPIVLIHCWWEQAFTSDTPWLSTVTTVGLSVPRSHEWDVESRLTGRISQIVNDAASKDELRDWLIHPAFRMDYQSARRVRVWVMRVAMHNQSRRRVVTPEAFGKLRFDIEAESIVGHGWRNETFTNRGSENATTSRDEVIEEVGVQHPLDPKETIKDDFTVTQVMPSITSPTDQPRLTTRTTSAMRLRIKPWEPAKSRPIWVTPYRAWRWISKSRRPAIYAPR